MSKLKTIRCKIGATQAELAREIGLSQSAINHYENGNRSVDTTTGWRIVQALNRLGAKCTFEDVFPKPQSNTNEVAEIEKPPIKKALGDE